MAATGSAPQNGEATDNRQCTPGGERLGWGVYYGPSDYASLWRRMIILATDGAVLLGIGFALGVAWFLAEPGRVGLPASFYGAWLAIAYLYLAVLARTDIRTLGYIVTGAAIVDLRGHRPSLTIMTVRTLWLLLGPFNLLFLAIDLLWLTGERNKQTLRDRLAGTYVIKKGAKPAGTGRQRAMIYHLMGMCFRVPDVKIESET